MGIADYLALGDWNAICARCGAKFKASMLRREWQGYYVCSSCHEPRHPQDFVRGIPDVQVTPWAQPALAPTYVAFCSIQGSSGMSGQAVSGCMTPGKVLPPSMIVLNPAD